MCFYRTLNETNEWGPWPLRGAEGREVGKQLPEVAQRPQHQCPVRSSGDLGPWAWAVPPAWALVASPGEAVGPEVVLSGRRFLLICHAGQVRDGEHAHRPAFGTCRVGYCCGCCECCDLAGHRGSDLRILGGGLGDSLEEGGAPAGWVGIC